MSQPEGAAVRLVFVDVDGTLLDCSSERLFLGRLLRTGSLRFRSVLLFAARYVAHPLRTKKLGPGWNRSYLAGADRDAVHRLAGTFADEVLKRRMRPDVLEILEHLSAEGGRIVLLSASLSFLVEPLGRAVGALESVGSFPEDRDGVFTGGLTGERPWGTSKAARASEIAAREGASLEDCCALGDSVADIPLLSSCGKAIAVYPSAGLRRAASSCGWTIVGGR